MSEFSLASELKRVILPLVAVADDATWHPIGTAFVVAFFDPQTALLMTAAHNLDQLLSIDQPRARHAANMPPDFAVKLPPSRTLGVNPKGTFYAA